MVTCPYCAAPNRRGSKYCSNCGERVDTIASIRCISCDGPNPPGTVVCQFCGLTLVPAPEEDDTEVWPSPPSLEPLAESEVAGSDSTTSPQRQPPSWLYEGTAEERPEPPPPATAPPAEDQVHEEEEPNKYLRGISGVLPREDGWVSSSLSRHLQSPAVSGTESAAAEDEPI
ncbi:MAG: hypothetical protein AMJ93_01050 [Anaerolineae bacterium SM23_84]|nr:MAG: hypothetical protein AMJ93_01050 [Anaerolineae bacterium SM23_84]